MSKGKARTLQGFSTSAQAKMYDGCPGCPYKAYSIFYQYYGSFTYADDWVSAALDAVDVTFPSGKHGPNNFSTLGDAARIEAVKTGTAYMHVWMYAIGKFENAIDDCERCRAPIAKSPPPPPVACTDMCTDVPEPFFAQIGLTCATAAEALGLDMVTWQCDGANFFGLDWPALVLCQQTCADLGHNYADPPCCTSLPAPAAPPPAPTICNEHAASTVSVHAWDEGVAFYTGSLEGTAYGGDGAGKLLYRLAEKRCANFGTCLESGTGATGTSQVNAELFELFDHGRDWLQQGRCSSVRPLVDQIVSLMTVPLVQGALRSAFKNSQTGNEASPKNAAEGATFSAAVLPLVHHCNTASAAVVSDNLKFGLFPDGVTDIGRYSDFAAVKAAFEDVYACLGITCTQVGGLHQAIDAGVAGATPCISR